MSLGLPGRAIYTWIVTGTGTQTLEVKGSLAQIAATGGDLGEDVVWGLNQSGAIFRWDPFQGFLQVPGRLAQIAVGNSRAVWGLNTFGENFTYNVKGRKSSSS